MPSTESPAFNASDTESGSAPVEFVMVSGLLVALVLAALQVSFVGMYRTVVTDAVVSGSAYAALADVSDPAGITRARDMLRSSFGRDVADSAVFNMAQSEPGVVAIEARVRLPVIGMWGVPGALTIVGRSFREVMP
jgi:hypothetical protein